MLKLMQAWVQIQLEITVSLHFALLWFHSRADADTLKSEKGLKVANSNLVSKLLNVYVTLHR